MQEREIKVKCNKQIESGSLYTYDPEYGECVIVKSEHDSEHPFYTVIVDDDTFDFLLVHLDGETPFKKIAHKLIPPYNISDFKKINDDEVTFEFIGDE